MFLQFMFVWGMMGFFACIPIVLSEEAAIWFFDHPFWGIFLLGPFMWALEIIVILIASPFVIRLIWKDRKEWLKLMSEMDKDRERNKLPEPMDFSDLGRGALDNLYAARQCHSEEEKINILLSVIEKSRGRLLSCHSLKELEWYVLDMWGFDE